MLRVTQSRVTKLLREISGRERSVFTGSGPHQGLDMCSYDEKTGTEDGESVADSTAGAMS